MRNFLCASILLTLIFTVNCNTNNKEKNVKSVQSFTSFETNFLDAYWKQYPSYAILVGYGKYYDHLVIPDSSSLKSNLSFSKRWTDSLNKMEFDKLSDNDKISFNIIKNQLETDDWYQSVFKEHEWDASVYNLTEACYSIITQSYAPLTERLKTLSSRLQNSTEYYQAAFYALRQPTREHIELSILQNNAGLSVFGADLTDSINSSKLTDQEKASLKDNVIKTVKAIKTYVDFLKEILANKNYSFRSFKIGKELFTEKFRYDLVTDFTPEEIYNRAINDKKFYYDEMFVLANDLWSKYFHTQTKPTDSLAIIQSVIDKIALQHVTPANLFDTLTSHVYQLKHFIIQKDLFDFDTTYPIKVRLMPSYARGVTIASAEFPLPYQKEKETYYNIDDLTEYPKEKAESALREYNNYALQILSIHEAVPGHCLQGIYTNKKSPDILRSVFVNGAMIEGWGIYAEAMMLENGWGNNSPEMKIIYYKHKLRGLANVIIDYDIHCIGKTREDIMHLLINECFQTSAQAEEKYHRATVSQVQLCTYYTGAISILSLREAYKKKMGDKYKLKDFHEKFLSFGSSPIKYIRERMLQ